MTKDLNMNEKNKYDNSCHIPNEETIMAVKETEKIILGNICTKKYSSVEDEDLDK